MIDIGGNGTFSFSGVLDGHHTIHAVCYDSVGNSDSCNISFIKDSTAPTIEIASPLPGSALPTSSVIVIWNGSDVGSGMDRYYIRSNGGTWNDCALSTSYTYDYLTECSYNVEIKAIDKAGNHVINSTLFVVDRTGPSIQILSPSCVILIVNNIISFFI